MFLLSITCESDLFVFFFFSSRRRHPRFDCDWSSDVCSSDLIVHAIAALQTNRRQVVLVSSGAVGLGRGWLGLHPSRLKDMVTKQACAAVGQSLLMEAYKRLFGAHDVKIAQVLLTEEDFSNWQRYSNLRRTLVKMVRVCD